MHDTFVGNKDTYLRLKKQALYSFERLCNCYRLRVTCDMHTIAISPKVNPGIIDMIPVDCMYGHTAAVTPPIIIAASAPVLAADWSVTGPP